MLQLALDCYQYGALPRDGGIDGQRAGEIEKLRKLANVYYSFRSRKDTKFDQEKWSEDNPGQWAIVAYVERMRAKHA